jgi:hypothetical protein
VSINGNSCSSTQWLRQLAAIRRIRRTHVILVCSLFVILLDIVSLVLSIQLVMNNKGIDNMLKNRYFIIVFFCLFVLCVKVNKNSNNAKEMSKKRN